MAVFFPHSIATNQYRRIPCFDAYPFPWPSLGSITCPLVYSAKKRLEHLDISELAVSEMRQNRQDMGLRIAFCFKVGYAYHKVELLGSGTQARQHQQRKNTMILEAFFSTVAS